MSALRETEAAFTAIWSRFIGGWEQGSLHRRDGVTWFESPIRHLPYNGVVETHLPGPDERLADEILGAFAARGVQCFWALHPLSTPADMGELLAARGLTRLEDFTCMAADLGGWSGPAPRPGVSVDEVADADGLAAYTALTLRYWEIPGEDASLVAAAHGAWGPRPDFGVRYLARVDDEVVGKGFLCLDAGTPGVAAVYGMSVLPAARGRGVAAALTTTMLARAQAEGYHRAVLHSTPMAVGVYRRAGFEPVAPMPAFATAPLWSGEH